MTVLRVLWSITWGSWLTALAIMLIRVLFRKVLSPKAKYYLWLLLALRLMLPVLPQSSLSVQNVLPQPTATVSVLPGGSSHGSGGGSSHGSGGGTHADCGSAN